MELTRAPYERIAPLRPRPRGKVSLSNLPVLNAILDVAEHGGQWRRLPEPFGNGHTIDTRRNRWSKNGVLDRVFAHRQRQRMIRIRGEAMGLDSTRIKGHPEGTGALQKRRPGHRKVPGRVEHPASSGGRGCPHGRCLRALSRQCARCPGGAEAPAAAAEAVAPTGTGHGSGL